LTLTKGKSIIGILIIIAGISLVSIGAALVSQTPDPLSGATEPLDGLAQWAQNVGIAFAISFGTGLYYLGFLIIAVGCVALLYWHFT